MITFPKRIFRVVLDLRRLDCRRCEDYNQANATIGTTQTKLCVKQRYGFHIEQYQLRRNVRPTQVLRCCFWDVSKTTQVDSHDQVYCQALKEVIVAEMSNRIVVMPM